MGYVKDVSNVSKDLKRWYKELSGLFRTIGLDRVFKKMGSKASQGKNNTGDKFREKYDDLCKWLQGEMAK